MSKTIAYFIADTFKNLDYYSLATQQVFKQYYHNLHMDSDGAEWLKFNEKVFTFLYSQLNKKMDILDIGAGCGSESLAMASFGNKVTSIDIKKDRLSVLGKRAKYYSLENQIHIKNKSVFELNKQFDLIWMNQTFHHVEPRNEFINKINSLLKPGGVVMISDLNALNPFLQIMLYLKRGNNLIKIKGYNLNGEPILYGDENITTAKSIIQLMDAQNLNLYYKKHFRIFPNSKYFRYLENCIPEYIIPTFLNTHLVVAFYKPTKEI
jgi:2-polyprenyl-3-methyl-5-hydroxy-6-metoxy-1,4-benzoquinol methylase